MIIWKLYESILEFIFFHPNNLLGLAVDCLVKGNNSILLNEWFTHIFAAGKKSIDLVLIISFGLKNRLCKQALKMVLGTNNLAETCSAWNYIAILHTTTCHSTKNPWHRFIICHTRFWPALFHLWNDWIRTSSLLVTTINGVVKFRRNWSFYLVAFPNCRLGLARVHVCNSFCISISILECNNLSSIKLPFSIECLFHNAKVVSSSCKTMCGKRCGCLRVGHKTCITLCPHRKKM